MSRYVVDYGHCLSGADTGASGNGYREEVLTREVGKKVTSKLKMLGHEVLEIDLSYSNTLRDSLNERIKRINAFNPDLSISIHFNAFNGVAYGSEILTDGYNSNIANAILEGFKALGFANRGIKDGSELAVVGGVNPYAMLVECCFIDNVNDMNKYNPEAFANAIVKGICGKLPQINNSQNNIAKERKYDMKNLVCYCNQVDKRSAEYLADYLQCPCIDATLPFNYEGVAENIIAVGGSAKPIGFSGYTTKYIAGSDRYETIKEVLKFMGKL